MTQELINKNDLDSFLIGYVPKRYLNQREAVHYTGTSAGTINEWVKKGLKVIIFGENSRRNTTSKISMNSCRNIKSKEVSGWENLIEH